jgi:hypothetical protein
MTPSTLQVRVFLRKQKDPREVHRIKDEHLRMLFGCLGQ